MIFLKWYSIFLNVFALLCTIYKLGRDRECIGFLITIILYLPLIVYLILS